MRGISKKFGSVSVLKDVDFDVVSGEVHALLGANGAGKSTLIKVLAGLYPDAEGSIELDEAALDLRTPRAALLAGVGIVHQEFDLVPDLSVAENVFLGIEDKNSQQQPGLLRPMRRGSLQKSTHDLLTAYDLEINPSATVADLAPGAQQLVQIARVLALSSNVVVFDEPTARLGLKDRERLFQIFARLKQHGKKLVFVTHYLDEVIEAADRASVMRDGRLIGTTPVPETNTRELSRQMVGEEVKRPIRQRSAAAASPIIEVENAEVAGRFEDASFSISSGEIVGLVGHLGSGRHELSRCIAGYRRMSGSLRFLGAADQPAKVGFVPEDRRHEGIFPQLSVEANIGIGSLGSYRLFSRLPRRDMRKRSMEVIDRLQLKTSGPSQLISALSGGNQQKAVFGRSLVSSPNVYVIECPTVGVDVRAAAELHHAIFALAERGAAILLSTDDLDEAILLADRVLVMRKGRITEELVAEDLSHQTLVLAMGAG